MKLYTVYQPIVNLETSSIIGHEALLRSAISPELLFKRAEQINRTLQLDIYSMNLALKTYKNLGKKDGLKLFLNCHPTSFLHCHSFLTLALMRNAHIDPNSIIIELTEHKALDDLIQVKKQAKSLNKLGIKLAIDDFGHGFNNLSLIDVLKPEYIKLDKQLLENLTSDRSIRSLVSGIKKLTDEIKIGLIAEGIETKEQLDILKSLGIRLGQGFYLGVPKPEIVVANL